jgi:hypothetical protein
MTEDTSKIVEQSESKVEDIIAIVGKIVDIEDDGLYKAQRDDFIIKNLDNFISSSEAIDINSAKLFSVEGFIHPDSVIKPNLVLNGYKLDDNEIYSNLLDNIRYLKNTEELKDKGNRLINLYAVFKTVGDYYGNYMGDEGIEYQNREFLHDHITSDLKPFSIKEFKSSKIATCSEQASISQNLFTFLGYKSELLLSMRCELVKHKPSPHAFNIITSENGIFIIETTNPQITIDSENNLKYIHPAFYPISEDQYNQLMSGRNVSVEHTDYEIDANGNQKKTYSTRDYGGLRKSDLTLIE